MPKWYFVFLLVSVALITLYVLPSLAADALLNSTFFSESEQSTVFIRPQFSDGRTNIIFYADVGDNTFQYAAETTAHGDFPFSEYFAPPPGRGTYRVLEYFNDGGAYGCSGVSPAVCAADPHFLSQSYFEITGDVTPDVSAPEATTGTGPATFHVISLVVNGAGGTAIPSDISVHVQQNGGEVLGSPASGSSAPGLMYEILDGIYTVSAAEITSYYQSFTGDCDVNGTVILRAGEDKICTIVNSDIPPLPPALPSSASEQFIPIIGIVKIPAPMAMLASGSVTYDYTVWNVGGLAALADVTVTDDACDPVTLRTGDDNDDGKLDAEEVWTYRCATTLLETTTNTAIATGFSDDGAREVAIDTAIATVVVGASFPETGTLPPLIDIVSVPSRRTPFSQGGGDVTYSYTVTNPGEVPMHGVAVTDDSCSPVSFTASDRNGNTLLEPGEVWEFTCRTHVAKSTRSIATAVGRSGGFTALSYAFATVLVKASTLTTTGLILLVALLIFLVAVRVVSSRKHKRKSERG